HQCIADLINVVPQSIASERHARLERERVAHCARVKSGDRNVEGFNLRLFAGGDLVSHSRANTARANLLDWIDCRVKVTSIAQVRLNIIRVAKNELLGKSRTRLDKIQTCAYFVSRDRFAHNCSRDFDAHVADLDLTLHHETQPHWTSLSRAFFNYFNAHISDTTGIEQRLQRIAYTNGRERCVWDDF